MSTDFTISTIPFGTSTETKDSGFRQIIEDIRSPKWKENVAAIHEAYARGAASAVPKEIRGEMETIEEAQVRAGKEAAAALKLQLPGFLFSGTFSERNAKALLRHSGLICADLDCLGNTTASIKEQISADSHVLGVFVSPTGTGLKVIFRCDPEKPHKETFAALEHYVAETFGLAIDQACSDVSRICYASHDPEAFIAEEAAVLPYPPPAPEKTFTPKAHAPGSEISPGDDFNQRGIESMPALLESHGWTHSHSYYWRRPGKTTGLSASLGYVAPGILRVFSSSPETGLPGDKKAYDPFAVYTHLEHNGNWHGATRALGASGYGSQSPIPKKSRQEFTLEKVAGPAPEPLALTKLRSIFDFGVVADGDASILLGERYLNRGDGMVIVSTSGMGKSAMCVQGATELALNRGPFGIQGNGPLKSLIVQSEDSDGDIGEVAHSIKTVLELTPQQITEVNSRVKVVCDRINRGARFIAALKLLIVEFKPDLVWINPLQAFIDGDVTDSKDLGAFLREGLNSLNSPPSFGYIIIHHTTKPATGKERAERQWHEVMYDMAGGAEIINWARAILSLRATPTEGEFNLVLAKRGRRAGVTKKVPNGVGFILEPVTTIPLKHAKGHIDVPGHKRGIPKIYWEPREADATQAPEPQKRGGRPAKYLFEYYADKFPAVTSQGLPLAQLSRHLSQTLPIKPDALFHALRRWKEEGHVESIPDPGKEDRYRRSF